MTDSEVLIVGGGPAGSSLGFALAKAGVDVHIVDRARFPRPKPCAEYLSPEASRILAAMGALERVEQSGAAALAGIRVRAPNGEVIRGDFIASHGFRGYRDRGLSVRREVLDAILLDCARDAGAQVSEGTHVVDVVRDNGGRVNGISTLVDGTKRESRARLVIGADGLRSIVARRVGLAQTKRWPRRMAFVTHYSNVRDIGEHAEMHVEHGGYVGIADVGNGMTTVALVVTAAQAREASGDLGAFIDRWLAKRRHLAPRFVNAERVTPVVATGPFASHARRAWSPGVALVGDAADFFDPFTGEGMYSALRGGELLGDALVSALAATNTAETDAQLEQYDRRRRTEFGGKWIVEKAIGAVVGSVPLINRAARNLSIRKDLADLLAGVTGDFVPASRVISLRYLWNVFITPG